jgi:hypothetical protein
MADFELQVPGQQVWIAGAAIIPVSASVVFLDGSDPLTGNLTYTATGMPNGIAMSTAGVFTGTPINQNTRSIDVSVSEVTASSIVVTVTDADGNSDSQGFEFIIVDDLADTVNVNKFAGVTKGVNGCSPASNAPASPSLANIIAGAASTYAVEFETVSTIPVGAGNIATNQATMTSVASLIVAARPGAPGTGRINALIENFGGIDVYVGGPSVTVGTGIKLPSPAGTSMSIDTTAALYGIVASGSQTVGVLETY